MEEMEKKTSKIIDMRCVFEDNEEGQSVITIIIIAFTETTGG